MALKQYNNNTLNKPELNIGDTVIIQDPCNGIYYHIGIIFRVIAPGIYEVLYRYNIDSLDSEYMFTVVPNPGYVIAYYETGGLAKERRKLLEVAIAGHDKDVRKAFGSIRKESDDEQWHLQNFTPTP